MVKNHKITFLFKEITPDSLGQQITQWVESGHTALAEVSGISGRLYYEAARTNDEETVLFKVLYSSWMKDLNKIDYRIKYNGEIYVLKHIVDIRDHHREVHLRGYTVNDKSN